MEKPPVTSTRALRPLGPTSTASCLLCLKPQAKWLIVHERFGQSNICSLCFLQHSGWSELPAAKILLGWAVGAVSRKRGHALDLHEGRLLNLKDADDVLGLITLRERFSFITGKDV